MRKPKVYNKQVENISPTRNSWIERSQQLKYHVRSSRHSIGALIFWEGQDTHTRWLVQIKFTRACFHPQTTGRLSLRHVSPSERNQLSRNFPRSFPGGFRDLLLGNGSSCQSRCVDIKCKRERERDWKKEEKGRERKSRVQVDSRRSPQTSNFNVITNGCWNEYKHSSFVRSFRGILHDADRWKFTATSALLFAVNEQTRKYVRTQYSLTVSRDDGNSIHYWSG